MNFADFLLVFRVYNYAKVDILNLSLVFFIISIIFTNFKVFTQTVEHKKVALC